MKQSQEQPVAQEQQLSSFDYFADDEDLSQERSPINSFLSKPYILEASAFGFLAFFFALVNGIGK